MKMATLASENILQNWFDPLSKAALDASSCFQAVWQVSLFLIAPSGKLGYKTACPNVPEQQNSTCKVKKSGYVDGFN